MEGPFSIHGPLASDSNGKSISLYLVKDIIAARLSGNLTGEGKRERAKLVAILTSGACAALAVIVLAITILVMSILSVFTLIATAVTVAAQNVGLRAAAALATAQAAAALATEA
ncbi:hypothetical protein Ddye_018293 [Dipteronia dyeriana]|uniref:Uncharacterized protein n=1 Tax=Dipteronia dyeriana TaxID=168575 RepID=A0AAD9X0L8_9ROSI|nr:hypothetical protein Ddye_018293 [Dipteronia dyeriana]